MLINTFKQIAKQTIDAEMPMDVVYGDVTSVSPLTIQIDPRLILSGEVIKLPRGTTLQLGDKAILLRKAGGQEYVVMGAET